MVRLKAEILYFQKVKLLWPWELIPKNCAVSKIIFFGFLHTYSWCSPMTRSSSGWVLTTNIFLELESMDFKLFKTVPESIPRHLNEFLQHQTHPLKISFSNPFLGVTKIAENELFQWGTFDALKTNEIPQNNFRHGFRKLRLHTFGFLKNIDLKNSSRRTTRPQSWPTLCLKHAL